MAKTKKGPIEPKSKADFDLAISTFAKQVGVSIAVITNEQMRLLLRDAMTFTPPMPRGGGNGLGQNALKAGRNAIARDVRRIFVAADMPQKAKPLLLRQVIEAVKTPNQGLFFDVHFKSPKGAIDGLSPVMRKIMQDPDYLRAWSKAKNYLNRASVGGSVGAVEPMTTDFEGIHNRYKSAVGGRWKMNQPIGGPQHMAPNALMLEHYIALRQFQVGRVKSGWASAVQKMPKVVGTRNYGVYEAPWVDVHRSASGQFSMSQTPQSVAMTATNLIGDINNVASEANMPNIVYGSRVASLNSAVAARTKDHAERANRKK